MDPRLTWRDLRRVAQDNGCSEVEEREELGQLTLKWILIRRSFGGRPVFAVIPFGEDDEKIEWPTLRSIAVILGIPFSAFGAEAARHLINFGE